MHQINTAQCKEPERNQIIAGLLLTFPQTALQLTSQKPNSDLVSRSGFGFCEVNQRCLKKKPDFWKFQFPERHY